MGDSRVGAAGLLVGLLFITAFLYWPGLQGPLMLDDVPNLEPLRELAKQGRLSFSNLMGDRGSWFDRPVSMLSFYANWLLTGDDVWALKLTNLLLHLVTGVLIYFLVQCLLLRVDSLKGGPLQSLAFGVTALWLLTPIQVSTVLYIIQRMAQLATLFSIAGLLCYSLGRSRLARSPVQGVSLIVIALLVFWPLATLSKENGVLLPLLLLITEWFFFSDVTADKWIRAVRIGLLLSVVIPAVLAVAYAISDPQWVMKAYALRDFSLQERLLTQPRVLLDYAANIVQLPGISPLGFFHDDFTTSVSLINPLGTLPAVIVLLVLPGLCLYFRKRGWGVECYGILFFIFAQLLEAGIFPLEMYFEHRNYLPGFGLLLALVVGLYRLGRILAMARVFKALLFVVMASYAVMTAARAWVWGSWDGIVRVAVAKHPASVRAQAGVAITYLLARDIRGAMPYLQREKKLSGTQRDDAVHLKLVTGYCLAGRPVPPRVYEALDSDAVLVDDAPTVSALRWFQDVISKNSCDTFVDIERMADILQRRSLRLSGPGTFSHNWEVHYYLGRLFTNWNRTALAKVHYKRAYRYAPGSRISELRNYLRTSQP